jgi:acetyl esterase/lipase
MNSYLLPAGGAIRFSGPTDGPVVICMNGGLAHPVPGDWSPSIEWLVGQLVPRFPQVGFAELRYRIKSWRQLGSLVIDATEAIAATRARGASDLALLGFSAGGATSLVCAGTSGIKNVIALAPWIPEQLDLAPLAGTRILVLHGSLDGDRFGFPGVSPRHSQAGVARLRAAGAEVIYTTIGGGVHGVAIRPFGRMIPLPRSGEWLRLVSEEVASFSGAG